MKAKTRHANAPHRVWASELREALDEVLPNVLEPLRRHGNAIPPLRHNQPRATVIAPNAIGAEARPACACGRPAAFKDTRNGRPRYRTECTWCRANRRERHPKIARPIALPHAVRPRCAVPACRNAITIQKKAIQTDWELPTWVPPDAVGIFLGSPWCDRHSRLNDRPVGVLTPPPTHPRSTKARPFLTGYAQWSAWRRRLRVGLGLPAYGTVSWTYTAAGRRVISVSTTGRGMRVTAWPDVIYAIAWWTARMPLQKVTMSDDLKDWWPTYGSLATALGIAPATVVWVVWELRTGRIMVRGCPVQRIPCVGSDGVPYTQAVKHILDPKTWQWTEPTPDDLSACAAVRWKALKVENPPTYAGTRIPWRYRSPTARREGKSIPPELLPPARRKSTSV